MDQSHENNSPQNLLDVVEHGGDIDWENTEFSIPADALMEGWENVDLSTLGQAGAEPAGAAQDQPGNSTPELVRQLAEGIEDGSANATMQQVDLSDAPLEASVLEGTEQGSGNLSDLFAGGSPGSSRVDEAIRALNEGSAHLGEDQATPEGSEEVPPAEPQPGEQPTADNQHPVGTEVRSGPLSPLPQPPIAWVRAPPSAAPGQHSAAPDRAPVVDLTAEAGTHSEHPAGVPQPGMAPMYAAGPFFPQQVPSQGFPPIDPRLAQQQAHVGDDAALPRPNLDPRHAPQMHPAAAALPPSFQQQPMPQPYLYQTHMELPFQPDPWGGIFRYNRCGELLPGLCLTAPEVNCFLRGHPARDRLRLILQSTPFATQDRYPDVLSSRCRFLGCPVRGNIIRPGQFRVALDEQPSRSRTRSSFVYAGFVHLWCLERFCDFPQICHDYNVCVENRPVLAGGVPNILRIDPRPCADVASRFIETCQGRGDLRVGGRHYPHFDLGPRWVFEGTLAWRLGKTFVHEVDRWYADRLMPFFGDLERLPKEPKTGLFGAHDRSKEEER